MSTPRTILGIDPGYGRCGFGVIEARGLDVVSKDYGVATTKAGIELGVRLSEIARDIEELIDTHKPDLVAVEKLFFSTNVKTAMNVSEARGVIMMTCARKGCEVLELTPNQIKVAVTGSGTAKKDDVQRMVTRLLNLKEIPKPDDAADALAIAITAVGFHRLDTVQGSS